MLTQFLDPHTIEVLKVLYEFVFITKEDLADLIFAQKLGLAISVTLYKDRIEQRAIYLADDIKTGKNNARIEYVLCLLAAFTPGLGVWVLCKQLADHCTLLGPVEVYERTGS